MKIKQAEQKKTEFFFVILRLPKVAITAFDLLSLMLFSLVVMIFSRK